MLAVGGTQLNTDSLGNYLSETGWSGSGGGISTVESQPSYQKGVVTQSSTMRTVPDVAYDGSSSSPFAVYDTSSYSGWIQVYGTSAGAPQWAALIAIADQGRALGGQSSLDGSTQTLPTLYGLPAGDYHDITSGSNGGYTAAAGYDLVTGMGTPRANLIAPALSNQSTSQGPSIVTPASATPNPVTGTTANLSVSGTDPSGTLNYAWSVTSAPAGAAAPTFGNSAAANTSVAFHLAGAYTFQVTLTDPAGLSASSSASVTVNQTLTSIVVSPAKASVADGGSLQFSAVARDQFGNNLSTQPSFAWSLAAGSGSVVANAGTGLYTAPSSGSGTATIQASAGAVNATATVTYGALPAAPTNLTATAISSRKVNLAWTESSTNVTGFVVQRANSGGNNWTTIATIAANVTSYADASVNKNKSYAYRVYAYNSFGSSGYSNTATVTTPSVAIAAATTSTSSAPPTQNTAAALDWFWRNYGRLS